jgi:hypothetical protein
MIATGYITAPKAVFGGATLTQESRVETRLSWNAWTRAT